MNKSMAQTIPAHVWELPTEQLGDSSALGPIYAQQLAQ
jgi:hypothetical protein